MPGEMVLGSLRHCRVRSAIPVLLASDAHRVADAAHALSVAGYLQKPFDVDALLAVVQQQARSLN